MPPDYSIPGTDANRYGSIQNPLVVAALSAALRGQPRRNPGTNDDTTRHFSGRSVRVLAFGLAFVITASRIILLRRGFRLRYGGQNGGTGDTETRGNRSQ
jgi:hypothetical protein